MVLTNTRLLFVRALESRLPCRLLLDKACVCVCGCVCVRACDDSKKLIWEHEFVLLEEHDWIELKIGKGLR